MCIALTLRHKPYLRAFLSRGFPAVESIDTQLYTSSISCVCGEEGSALWRKGPCALHSAPLSLVTPVPLSCPLRVHTAVAIAITLLSSPSTDTPADAALVGRVAAEAAAYRRPAVADALWGLLPSGPGRPSALPPPCDLSSVYDTIARDYTPMLPHNTS